MLSRATSRATLKFQQDLNFSFINPDNLPTVADNSIQMNQRTFSLTTTIQMPDTDYYQVLRSLNIKQRLLLDYIFKWTTDMRLSCFHVLNSIKSWPYKP